MKNNTTCGASRSLILLLLAFVTVESSTGGDFDIKRSDFPDGFLFGAATSAHQIEGAYLEDGSGPSNWDNFSAVGGNLSAGDNGYIANDYYHRYMEDIEIMHSLGVNAYRFSISWSRVLPKGKFGEVNQAAIIFYNKIIDNILLRGIQPFVTIHHFDYPQELEDRYGGWLSPLMQEDFVYFAEICFMNFADRVKHWATINEPNVFVEMAYVRAVFPPARCSPPYGNCAQGNSDVEPLTAVHNMLLAHAKASKLYGEQFKLEVNGMIGIILNAFMYIPLTDNEEDKEAAKRALAFNVACSVQDQCLNPEGWHIGGEPIASSQFTTFTRLLLDDSTNTPERRVPKTSHGTLLTSYSTTRLIIEPRILDPVVFGDYPPEMRRYHGNELPKFSSDERALLRDSIDFIGINHYSTLYAKDCIYSSCTCNDSSCTKGNDRPLRGFVSTFRERNGVPIGEPTGMIRFSVVPKGMEGIVLYVKERYHNKAIFVTENGYSSPDNENESYQHDVKRVNFHKSYLYYLARAISNGADVRGYFIWTLMDDFEWDHGYNLKFGLYRIHHPTLNRIPKLSAGWYRDFLCNTSSSDFESSDYMLSDDKHQAY